MEHIGFFCFMLFFGAFLLLIVKAIVLVAWNAGKDLSNENSFTEVIQYVLKDIQAFVLPAILKPVPLISALAVFLLTAMLTPVSIFSATGYSVVTFVVLGFVLPRAKQALSSSKQKSPSET